MKLILSQYNIQEIKMAEMSVLNGGDFGLTFGLTSLAIMLVFGCGILTAKDSQMKRKAIEHSHLF